MKTKNIQTVNGKITECGLFYCPEKNTAKLQVIIQLPSSDGRIITIPENKYRDFTRLFQEDMETRFGVYFHNFKDHYVQVTLTGDEITALSDLFGKKYMMLN